ncbi:MAG TPA: hypothetical protein VKT53_03290 [Candidatus Acidoferrum sp.]|nr:hypothetical protein [Candidatus Acidoferrum sp.]
MKVLSYVALSFLLCGVPASASVLAPSAQDSLALQASLQKSILSSPVESSEVETLPLSSPTNFASTLSANSQQSVVLSAASLCTATASSRCAPLSSTSAADFLALHPILAELAAPSDPTNLLNFFGANTLNAETKFDHSTGATATSEPSTLLLFSLGLFFLPLLRRRGYLKRPFHFRAA